MLYAVCCMPNCVIHAVCQTVSCTRHAICHMYVCCMSYAVSMLCCARLIRQAECCMCYCYAEESHAKEGQAAHRCFLPSTIAEFRTQFRAICSHDVVRCSEGVGADRCTCLMISIRYISGHSIMSIGAIRKYWHYKAIGTTPHTAIFGCSHLCQTISQAL